MGYKIDLTGKVFGRLTVLHFVGNNKFRESLWQCQCECGELKIMKSNELRRGSTVSCGCYIKEYTAIRNMSHGMSGTSEYRIWKSMIQRCTNHNRPGYKDYGGRGIRVCERWLHSFELFYEDMGKRPLHYLLERIDNNGNYEPGNCRWATWKEQNRNKRNTKWITYNGETRALADWAEIININQTYLGKLLRRGTSIEQIIQSRSV